MFKKKKSPKKEEIPKQNETPVNQSNDVQNVIKCARKPKVSFQCQLAHGSPTGLITGITNVKELYSKIAECYDIYADEILFCTLNSHKIDMDRLLGSHIGLDDFIFVHIKGQKKEIELKKTNDSLGLTITDNGAGKAIIKRIREGSQIHKLANGLINVGDHIEKIDDEDFVGKRHYDVAKKLRSLSVDSKFILRLISPQKSIYGSISARSEYAKSSNVYSNIVSGKKTIRMSYTGEMVENELSNAEEKAAEMICRLVEKSLGISDTEMVQTILDLSRECKDPAEFSEAITEEMGVFEFSQNLINEFWGIVSDLRAGRLNNRGSSSHSYSSTPSTQITRVFEEERF